MKKLWISYRFYLPVILYAIAWIWIFAASANAGCSDNDPMAGLQGLCLARRIAGFSCYAIYFAVWTLLGGAVAQGKGRNPLIGWILGFTLQFMGCLGMMMMEPRRDLSGRMIGWDEYKHFTAEQREAIRPVRVPLSPAMRKRRKILLVIAIVAVLTFVFQVLKNLGKI